MGNLKNLTNFFRTKRGLRATPAQHANWASIFFICMLPAKNRDPKSNTTPAQHPKSFAYLCLFSVDGTLRPALLSAASPAAAAGVPLLRRALLSCPRGRSRRSSPASAPLLQLRPALLSCRRGRRSGAPLLQPRPALLSCASGRKGIRAAARDFRQQQRCLGLEKDFVDGGTRRMNLMMTTSSSLLVFLRALGGTSARKSSVDLCRAAGRKVLRDISGGLYMSDFVMIL
ncbi:hypothetical protein BDA96_04G152500 [Sorghum bicolor]|uniref:Uncharacterized protein n=1 Tax=Sorghum bicolor TaxID=4558 RepID=A0A921R4T5_SORBI|nr:hypothetical protein BDA96_04G152500 [Sorghum bicolor]